nr:ABC transporter ATP-binding protein [uncultured Carboxylicivirga sp.]
MATVIECNNITHYYGNRLIYKDLNFSVEKGKILGLLGKNGTGKTTIINILNGYLKPYSGECRLLGEDMRLLSIETKAKIGLLLEGHVQHNYFNIVQIEKFYSRFFQNWKSEYYWDLMDKLKVTRKQKISTMSCGQRSQVALGLILAQDPELLILDDFSMGLDPGYRRLFVDYLKEYVTATNKTIFLTSHIIQDMEHLIDETMILDYGKLLLHKPTQEILNNFTRFKLTDDVRFKIESDESIQNVEHFKTHTEFYSFDPMDKIKQELNLQNIDTQSLVQEQLTLEDAFIGLTGKY